MVFRMSVNSPQTGGGTQPLNSQTQKLAVGAQRAFPGHPVRTVQDPCTRGPVHTGVKYPVDTGFPSGSDTSPTYL
jgi:hypothetical protein